MIRVVCFFAAATAFALSVAIGLPAVGQDEAATAEQRPVAKVTVAKPFADRVTQWDEFSGRFEAVDNVEVRARVSGFINTIDFRDGQLVEEGQLLFTIDKRPFEIQVASARAAIERAEAQVLL